MYDTIVDMMQELFFVTWAAMIVIMVVNFFVVTLCFFKLTDKMTEVIAGIENERFYKERALSRRRGR